MLKNRRGMFWFCSIVSLILGLLILTGVVFGAPINSIIIHSPWNTSYDTGNITLNVSSTEAIDTIWYSLDGGPNVTFSGNTTLTGLSDGQHNIIVYGNDSLGKVRVYSIQKPFSLEEEIFGGPNDRVYSLQQTSDEGFILAGSINEGQNYVYLVKTDLNGKKEWVKKLGFGIAYSVQQTSDNGYIIAGETRRDEHRREFYIIKTDSNGTEEWSRIFGTFNDRIPNDDIAESIQQTSDGGYIIAGYVGNPDSNSGRGRWNGYLAKIDNSGNEEWHKTLGDTTYNKAYDIQQTVDGGYIVAGFIGGSNSDIYLIKTDPKGNEEWHKTFGGEGSDSARSVQQTSDGGYIIAGEIGSLDSNSGKVSWDAFLIKTDSNGNEEWNKTFGGSANDRAYDVQQTSDGGFILAGTTASFGNKKEAIYLVKTDRFGHEEWSTALDVESIAQYIGYIPPNSPSVQQTSQGSYIIAGRGRFLYKFRPPAQGTLYFTVDRSLKTPITSTRSDNDGIGYLILTIIIIILALAWYINEQRELIKIEAGYENLSPYDFEYYVAQIFKDNGYKVEVTRSSGDFGADVIAKSGGEKIAIQVKKFTTGNVGVKDVNHLIGSLYYYGAAKGIVVTTSGFTNPAVEAAKRAPIELWDRAKLNKEISKVLKKKNKNT